MEKVITNKKIVEFKKAFTDGISGLVRAAEIYVSAIDENPKNADLFRDEFADIIPSSAWAGFEAVGRKFMHPNLLMGGISDRKKNTIIKKMPYSVQCRIFNHERFPLLIEKGETLNIDILEATAFQVEQVCGDGSIRTLGEQRAWLEDQDKNIEPEDVEPMPYTIRGGSVVFRRGAVMTKQELRRILVDM